jgi:hypothetical protein
MEVVGVLQERLMSGFLTSPQYHELRDYVTELNGRLRVSTCDDDDDDDDDMMT